MANTEQNNLPEENESQGKQKFDRTSDLPDNAHDEERMQREEVIMDLPDVKDIPGQEFIHPPIMDSFSDTTISSDDEEGVGILDDDTDSDIDGDIKMDNEADVDEEEKQALERADTDLPTQDDMNLRKAELDQQDNEGEALNEGSLATNVSGSDLDTSGVDADDPMENIGEEDEENNTYSLGSDSNDNVTEGTP